MKTQSIIKFLLFALGLFVAPIAIAQADFATASSRTARILVVVNAQGLFSDPGADPKGYCSISDNQGGIATTGQGIENFSTDVFQGNNVHWNGEVDDNSSELGYSMEITEIELDGNENCKIFSRIKLPGRRGFVIARVDGNAEKNCPQRYYISFRLTDPDGNTYSFKLDPFLLRNP